MDASFYGKLLRNKWLVRVGENGLVYAREDGIGQEVVCGKVNISLAILHYNAYTNPQKFKETVYLGHGGKDFLVPLRVRASDKDEFWHRRACLLALGQGPRTDLDVYLERPWRGTVYLSGCVDRNGAVAKMFVEVVNLGQD